MIDFIDTARLAVQVPGPEMLVYTGTIVRAFRCSEATAKRFTCPYDITIEDQSALAQDFVNRYPKYFPPELRLQTQLFTIPQSRTIEIRGGPAERH